MKGMSQLMLLCGALFLLNQSAAAKTEANVKCPEPKYEHIDLVLVIDKSGSMHGLEDDTIGGFNSLLEKQKKLPVQTEVTTVMFNDKSDVVHERTEISKVEPLSSKNYMPGGRTALLDSVGSTIDKVCAYKNIDDKDNKVIFAIITDGRENASTEYQKKNVKDLIEKKQKDGWEFIFLGANIDAISEAGSIGISPRRTVQYKNSERGVRANYDAVASFAEQSALGVDSEEWKQKAEQDNAK
jgi:Mg-chelatase subunit ChlD